MAVRDGSEVVRLAASPLGPEAFEDVVIVDLRGVAGLDLDALRDIPQVVVGITDGECDEVDVVVADEEAAADLAAQVRRNPVAATALVLHLRSAPTRSIRAGLVAESATYSALQAGPEFQRWLGSRPARTRRSDDGERVRVRRDELRFYIELARPEARNAVDAAMQRALVDALASTDGDEEIVLTGVGPVFSAGGDLDEFGSRSDPATAHLLRVTRSPARSMARVADRTTVIVHGACHGAGVELPAFAHRVVARTDATFTLPELAMGLIPGAGGTVSIPRRIGRQRTAWLALTGRTIDVETARTWGLVDAVDDG